MTCKADIDLCLTKGDDKDYLLTFTDDSGTAVDITSGTVYFTCKKSLSDADSDAVFAKKVTNHSDPTNGKTTVSLSHADTDVEVGRYFYDIQLTLANKVHTLMKGTLEITYEVTEAV